MGFRFIVHRRSWFRVWVLRVCIWLPLFGLARLHFVVDRRCLVFVVLCVLGVALSGCMWASSFGIRLFFTFWFGMCA